MKTPTLDTPTNRKIAAAVGLVLLTAAAFFYGKSVKQPPTTGPTVTLPAKGATVTVVPQAASPTLALPAATDTAPAPGTATSEPPTATAILASDTPAVSPAPSSTAPVAVYTPWPAAPLCPDHDELHDNSVWHGIWESARGCHYDHEHGVSPFTPQVAAAFPGFDLQALMGGVQIGHTNLSSPLENTAKHGGFDWNVFVPVPHPGELGFESATVGVCALVSQFHNFGNYAIEFETRFHTALALVKQCMPGDLEDAGFIYTVQGMEYGQRTSPYQGDVLAYPDNFSPPFASGFGPYLTADCVGVKLAGQLGACRTSLAQILSGHLNAASKWTSKPTGQGARPPTSTLLQILFDIRDIYRVLDWRDQTHPFTWLWLCSSDGGANYNPAGCRYNNTTSTLHEIAGTVPAAWANLGVFAVTIDANGRTRLTGEAYTTRYGVLDTFCTHPSLGTQPGTDCWPVKLVSAFVGKWGANLCIDKCSIMTPANSPERDIFFCAGLPCAETAPGAVPSGWIGPSN